MPSVIEEMTGINIKSDYFSTAPTLELFSKGIRTALIYGKNGCGKTTMAQGFREYISPVPPLMVELSPRANGSVIPVSPGETGKFFVFDEDYVSTRIRVKEDGLSAIVLFGDQIDLEDQLNTLETEITTKKDELDRQANECATYQSAKSVKSPAYWVTEIKNELKKDTGWAGNGAKIKNLRHNVAVNDEVIDKLGSLNPKKSQSELQADFTGRLLQYSAVNSSTEQLTVAVSALPNIGDKVQQAASLLSQIIDRPHWTTREQEIFDLLGGQGLETAKAFLSNSETTICNQCLQPISQEYRYNVLRELDSLLNREVEEFKEKLKKLIIQEVSNTAYESYRELPSYTVVRNNLDAYSKAVAAHNSIVYEKINNPFEPQEYDTNNKLMLLHLTLSKSLVELESNRTSYNLSITKRKDVMANLLVLNDEIAHYTIDSMYSSLIIQRAAKAVADELLERLSKELIDLKDRKAKLDAKRKNFKLAAEEINNSLEYIFYCKGRLTLELGEDDQYHLKVNGRPVTPNKVSCGERNALALSYFFTEIANNTNAKTNYANEVFLVIDDPISSFDFENRIGVQSLLRWKLEDVLSGCSTSKILIMTHDITTAFDLEKSLKEIKERLKGTRTSADYQLLRLEECSISKLSDDQRNEYTQLIRRIFEYAQQGTGDELVIGNIMRRVLEAFATFSYKEGIENISNKDSILCILPANQRTYFKNLMYRLVLNSESHSKDRILSMKDYSFSTLLSEAEKQRTARDIICFMYLLNKYHVLSHLPQNAEADISLWISNIK